MYVISPIGIAGITTSGNSIAKIKINAATEPAQNIINAKHAHPKTPGVSVRRELKTNLINFFIFVSQDLLTIYQLPILTNQDEPLPQGQQT